MIENKLISPNESGFKPGDSWTNQPLSITHDIYKSYNKGFEIRGVFPDILNGLTSLAWGSYF